MEKTDFKTVICDKKCNEDRYFKALIQDLTGRGIRVVFFEEHIPGSLRPGECLCICAGQESVKYAQKEDIAYVSYKYASFGAQCEIEGFDEVDADFIIKMYQRKHGKPWVITRTERLIIREFTTEDDYEIFPEMAGVPDYTEQYIKNIYGFFGYGIWAVVKKDSSEVIGRAGLMNSERTDGIELGYEIAYEYRNRGYATEACRSIMTVARDYYGIEKLYAFTAKDNKASLRVLDKLGFTDSPDLKKDGIFGKMVKM